MYCIVYINLFSATHSPAPVRGGFNAKDSEKQRISAFLYYNKGDEEVILE